MNLRRGVVYFAILLIGVSFAVSLVRSSQTEPRAPTRTDVGCVFHCNRWEPGKCQVVTTQGTFIIQGDVSFFCGRKAVVVFDGARYWLEIDNQSRHEVLGL